MKYSCLHRSRSLTLFSGILLTVAIVLSGCGDGLPRTDKNHECQRVRIGEETIVLQTPYSNGSSSCATTLYRKSGKDVTVTELGYTLHHVSDNVFEILYDDYAAYWEPSEDGESDGIFMGHCYYRYPCFYRNGEFCEYETADVSENDFMKMDGAGALVDSLKADGWHISEIFSRQDGHLFLNLRRDLERGRFNQSFIDFTASTELIEGKLMRSVLNME